MRALLMVVLVASGCATTTRMQYRTVDSRAMGKRMEYGVYTPPQWKQGESLPVLLFLHGGGGDTAHCLEKEGVAAYLDREIESGRVPRVVIVVPQGDQGFWADWADGSRHYQSWAVEALRLTADEFGTKACPEGCHLMGISMGGNGAVRFVLDRPGLMSSAAIISGPILDAKGMQELMDNWFFRTFARLERVFGGDEARKNRSDPFQRWRSSASLFGTRLFIAHGAQDRGGLDHTNVHMHEHLQSRGIPHHYSVFPGGHEWQAWKPIFGEVIRFSLAAADGLTVATKQD